MVITEKKRQPVFTYFLLRASLLLLTAATLIPASPAMAALKLEGFTRLGFTADASNDWIELLKRGQKSSVNSLKPYLQGTLPEGQFSEANCYALLEKPDFETGTPKSNPANRIECTFVDITKKHQSVSLSLAGSLISSWGNRFENRPTLFAGGPAETIDQLLRELFLERWLLKVKSSPSTQDDYQEIDRKAQMLTRYITCDDGSTCSEDYILSQHADEPQNSLINLVQIGCLRKSSQIRPPSPALLQKSGTLEANSPLKGIPNQGAQEWINHTLSEGSRVAEPLTCLIFPREMGENQ